MECLLLNFYIQTDRDAYDLSEDYWLAVCRYMSFELVENILKGNLKLTHPNHDVYRLLVESYWLLHKILKYLLWTNAEGCAEGVKFMGYKTAKHQRVVDTNYNGRQSICRCPDPGGARPSS
jgi:hypothetical protein